MAESRDNSSLFTGLTSGKSREVKADRNQSEEERKQRRAILMPYEELIEEAIAEERKVIAQQLGDLINVDTDKEDIKSIVIGLRTADKRLISFGNKLKNTMRQTYSEKLEAEKEEDDE